MNKWENNRAWLLTVPVLILVAFSSIIPLMTVINYSVQDIMGEGQSLFEALWRQFLFSALVLLIEMPLGVLLALAMPKKGWGVSFFLVVIALPRLIPWNTIGSIWIIFVRPDIGLFGHFINNVLGIPFAHTARPLDAWITLMFMEGWHWTLLVALLAYAGLRANPELYYPASIN